VSLGAAQFLLQSLTVYAAVGFGVAVAFLIFGLDRVDDGAHGAYAFRPLMLPGLILLWPLVLWRWAVLARGGG
jgi:hypothetical protein